MWFVCEPRALKAGQVLLGLTPPKPTCVANTMLSTCSGTQVWRGEPLHIAPAISWVTLGKSQGLDSHLHCQGLEQEDCSRLRGWAVDVQSTTPSNEQLLCLPAPSQASLQSYHGRVSWRSLVCCISNVLPSKACIFVGVQGAALMWCYLFLVLFLDSMHTWQGPGWWGAALLSTSCLFAFTLAAYGQCG